MGKPLVDAEHPISVAVLASEGDARLRYLLEDDPNLGVKYDVVCGFVNVAESDATALLEAHDIPVKVRDIHGFYDRRDAPLANLDVRQEFDAHIAEFLASYEPDLVVLAGYLHIVTAPLLDRYFPRLINIHHADLTVRDESGSPVYPGLDAVEDAIRASEPSTRETTHIVTEDVDAGPLLARSPPFQVHRELVSDALARGMDDVLDAYVYAHRAWMIREGGGPTLAKTIELLTDGRISYQDGETIVDGKPGFFQLTEGVIQAGVPDADD